MTPAAMCAMVVMAQNSQPTRRRATAEITRIGRRLFTLPALRLAM
jgi:hypothetical protein